MKLILSSRDFRNEHSRDIILQNLPKPIEQCRVLFIPNEIPTRKGKLLKRLGECGFARNNMYLFDPEKAENFTDLELDCIFVSGGNTFAIVDKIRKTGLDRAILRYIKAGVTYIGGSAGVHFVSEDFRHVHHFDENTVGVTDCKGLGLFPGILVCHYGEERRAAYEALVAEGKYKVYPLTDEDCIVYEA
ncbi:MAG: Type 1 glutamine amidotransferase-like domain-containing protein [Clostridia bacterium]|nr:Type 1 glutamine amidotransferase-like domain-containing protein [Clostridia bacterium]